MSRTFRRKNVPNLGEMSLRLRNWLAMMGIPQDPPHIVSREKKKAYTDAGTRSCHIYGNVPKSFRKTRVRKDRHNDRQVVQTLIEAARYDEIPSRPQHRHSALYDWW